ncbi:Ig-like domain (group 4) [Paenibacillus sp. UNCCL117]|uniref:immunoglobulin-like domain-containing protein n=1 Tax=unclassified Paenibacillus TaxID=185978 RepID=UPI000891C578|nr:MULTISPECIES: immunoglobulin-like domain-containing protein [unclassified Paenibacillus]SDD03915.1 Ig-like domain (group 4) [Paenibacillus sp. cl123]SFW32202.1 Ig-like domain (group 4) [Paenibacillus sp. UNCCL117]
MSSKQHSIRTRIFSIVMSAMLIAGLFPAYGLQAVSAAATDTIYAAAYMGAKTTTGTTLPGSLAIEGQNTPVTWHIGEDTFAVPYETVTVTGTAGGAQVAASVEVIPPASNPLVYFVDSGRGGDSVGNGPTPSPLYEAVKGLTGAKLLNQLPDQKYVSGTTAWGLDDSVQKVKNSKDGGHTNPATDPSLWVVGLRSANDHIVYKLKALPAGTYTLSSGFHDWYGNRSRVIRPALEYQDASGGKKTILLDQFNTNATKSISSEFTIPADIDASVPMTLTYGYVSGEKPILSWFAIAEGGIKGMIESARHAAASTVKIMLDGNDIKPDNVNGLTFKGFGVLSANSTSALLMDYKSEHPEAYADMLRILFGGEHPIMTHVKIEMGNDRNNSTGPDPATMRTADEAANVKRHPGFQLAADAKAVNPDLKVSILRWSAPAWANSNDNIYTWYKNTILAAYREYGFMVDYVNPHINEHSADLAWTKQYAERVRGDNAGFNSPEEQALYNRIEIVISDEVGIGSFGGSMVSDASLRSAVSVAGYHYNTDDDSAGNFKKLAEQYDIEIWNSEAQATFSNSSFRPNNNMKDPSVAGTGLGGTGSALEMGNTIIKGFVNSRRTHFVYQPAIGSFYEGGQYSFKELLSARDPWSGWIHYDAGLVVLRHFNWFAKTGWENDTNTAGIWRAVPKASFTGASGTNPVSGRNGTPSYITLAAPDKSDFSTVIVNDSEYERIYKLQTVNMGYTGNPALEVWETRAADAGKAFNSNHMNYLGNAAADGGGVYTVRVKPYSVVTVTTLDKHDKTEYNTKLPVEGERTVLDTDASGAVRRTDDKILYADDFDYTGQTVPVIGAGGRITGSESYIDSRGGSKSVIPRYTHDRNGAFEAYLPDGSANYVLRQQLDKAIMGLGGTWNGGDPVTAIGDYRWTNYKASVDVSFENNSTQNGANYAAIGARYQGGGSSHTISGTPYVLKYWLDGGWQLLVNNSAVAGGNVVSGDGGVTIDGFNAAYDAWHNLAIQVAGSVVTAYLDGVKLASYTDPNPKLSGRVDLASGYYHVRFDNLRVETVDGYTPYYSEHLDNLEMHDLASAPGPKLIYSGPWSHRNGEGMYIYQRSLSVSQGAGAALTYTFTGTGLDILGPNDGSAKLEVTVDGEVVSGSAGTTNSKELYQTYALRGLDYGEHTVQLKVVSGTLTVDSVAVVSGEVQGTPDIAALQAAATVAQAISRQAEFKESDWLLFEASRHAAQAALSDPAAYRLDQEGADQLAARLTSAQDQLFTGDIRELASPLYAAAYVGKRPNLPEKVLATRADGTTQEVAVTWKLDGVSFDNAYETVAVTGTYGSLQTVGYVEVVPEDIRYFVDLNATATGLTTGHTSSTTLGYDSPAYGAVAALAAAAGKPLLNGAPDQVYDAAKGTGWGHAGYNAAGSPSVTYKGIVSGPYSKQSTTGIYTANQNGASVTYAFDNLPAGEYTLTLGTYSWWPSSARTEEVYLEYDDSSKLVDTITLNSSSFDVVRGYTFTKAGTGSLKLKLAGAQSNQSPLLSFVGVAPVRSAAVDKTALQALYDQHKSKENDNYTDASWGSFQTALADALNVLGKADATQDEVSSSLQALNQAVAGLVRNTDTSRTADLYATYAGTVPQLPLRIRLVDGGPEYEVNAWMIDGNHAMTAANFDTAYETVTVVGSYTDGGEKQFSVQVEVVPQNLKYFIDGGAANPYVYNAVRKLTGNALLNDSANQAYSSESGWGYIALSSSGAVKPIINKSAQPDMDKNATGIMIDGGDPLSTLSYRLDGLEGGKTYRFTSYHRLWWGNEMPIKIAVTYALNGETVTRVVNRLHLDHAGHSKQVAYSVNLPEGASDVRYVLTNAGSYTSGPGAGKTNKNAAISWLAVEELNGPVEPVTYDSIGGVAGENTDVWMDTNGTPIQAHGGQVSWVEHIAWNGNVPSYTASPAEGDGAWLWVGEDKTYGGRPIGGIHTYVSKDLYNWVDMGVALYPHRVFPMEKTPDGQGVQTSADQLAALKARAMGTAGTGVNEFGQPLTQFDIDYARNFLQAYVDRSAHPDYSRGNDASFNYAAASYDNESLELAFHRTYAYYTIMERPKMLYNDKTKKYVIAYHVDGPTDARILEHFDTLKNNPKADTGISRYSRAQMGFAVSDTPFGPFKLVNAQKMNYIEGYYDSNKGMARDMTVFKDDDGKAYAIYSSEENKYTYISLLNDSYTAPAQDGTEGLGETFTARVFTDASREAPAVFKYNGYYYFITSGTTGWDPNPSIAYRANHIFGNTADGGQTFTPYTKLGNPFPNDSSNTSYRTQSTAVIPYDPENGLFIYMGDRWIQKALDTSGYVWLPLQLSAGGTKIEGQTLSDWTLDVMDKFAPLEVLTTSDKAFKLGEALKLPDTLDLKRGKATYPNVPVTWNPASLEAASLTLGAATVQGTLGGDPALSGTSISFEVNVLPNQVYYFADSGNTDSSSMFAALRADSASNPKLAELQAVPDQVYADGLTWGYTNSVAVPGTRANASDPYNSHRRAEGSAKDSVDYAFELPAGEYDIYVGFYDPWGYTRKANIAVSMNGKSLASLSGHEYKQAKSIAMLEGVQVDEAGKVLIQTGPGTAGSNTAVMVSFIIITGKEHADTTKPVITLLGGEAVDLPIGAAYSDAGATARDDRDGDITNRIVTTYSWNGVSVPGVSTVTEATYKVHYNVSDAAGNAAAEVTRSVTVSAGPDVTRPVLTLLGEPVVNLAIGASYVDAGVTAFDDRDGDLTSRTVTSITYNGMPAPAISTVTAATYMIHYNVSDTAGNAALEITRTVHVSEAAAVDNVKPVITLLGSAAVRVEAGKRYTDAGAVAMDDRDGDITGRIVTTITRGGSLVTAVNTALPGIYTYHYNVSDAAGNTAAEVTREVIVYERDDDDSISTPPAGTPSPTAPVVPVTPEVPATTQVLGAEDFKTAVGGTVTVQMAADKDTVLLPGDMLSLIGDNSLRLTQANMSIEFPQETLRQILESVDGAQAEGAQIQFSAAIAPKDEAAKMIRGAAVGGSVRLAAASDMYVFNLQVIAADGTSVPVTAFDEPLTVTFKVDPNANPDLLGVYYIGADGALEFRGGTLAGGMMSAKLSHFSSYAVLEYDRTFADVDATSWAYDVIRKMAAKHIVEGVDAASFNPQGHVTRAQFAAMLARALGLTAADVHSFKDVDAGAWYAEAVAKVSKAGIVLGRTADTFAPDDAITREEMAVMTVRAYEYLSGKKAAATNPGTFADQGRIGAWAQGAVSVAQGLGLISGRGENLFAPQELMTRAEGAQVISNLLD